MKFAHLYLVLLVLCMAACQFSPNGDGFEEVNPVTEVKSKIDLNLINDTLFVRGEVDINFTIFLKDKKLYGYHLYLDKTLLNSAEHAKVAFRFRTTDFKSRAYTMKLQLFTNSGTGSMADVLDAEGVTTFKTWTVIIDNEPPTPIAITDIREENGQVRIEWERYKRHYFQYYNVYKTTESGKIYYVGRSDDRNTTYVLDKHYVGGKVKYVVEIKDGLYWGDIGSEKEFYAKEPTILEAFYNPDSTITLKFSATKFYNNFGSYTLQSYGSPGLYISLDNYQDTVVMLPFNGFGKPWKLSLRTSPKDRFNQEGTETAYTLAFGKPFYNYSSLTYSAVSNAYYVMEYSSIYKLDGAELQVLAKKHFNLYGTMLTLSPDGRYLYAALQSYIYQLDPNSLEILGSYAIADLLGHGDYVTSMQVSNTHRLAVHTGGYTQNENRTYIYDFSVQAKLLDLIRSTSWGSSHVLISTDGNTVFDGRYIRENQEGSWNIVKSISTSGSTTAFHPNEPLLFVANDKKISIYSTDDGSLLRDLWLDTGIRNIKIEPKSGNLSGQTEDYFHVYDSNTGKPLRKIKHLAEVTFLNNTFFSPYWYAPLQ